MSKSKERRKRAVKVKNRLWTMANFGCGLAQPFAFPSFWQPEPEHSLPADMLFQTAEVALACDLLGDVSVPIREHNPQFHYEHCKGTKSGVDAIVSQLDALQDELCTKLYPGNLLVDRLEPMGIFNDNRDDDVERDSFYYQDGQSADSSLFNNCEEAEWYLAEFQSRANTLKAKLCEAATFFNDNARQHSSAEDAVWEYWSLFEPDGIQQRRLENKQIEQEIEDLEVNELGHLFTYDRRQFWDQIPSNISSDLRRNLVTFGIAHPAKPATILTQDLRRLLDHNDPAAYDWQFEYDDNDDDDDELMTLLKMLKAIVQV